MKSLTKKLISTLFAGALLIAAQGCLCHKGGCGMTRKPACSPCAVKKPMCEKPCKPACPKPCAPVHKPCCN